MGRLEGAGTGGGGGGGTARSHLVGLLGSLLRWTPLCLPPCLLSCFLDLWVSNLRVYQDHLEGLLKRQSLDPTLEVSDAAGLGWVQGFTFLTGSQVTRMLRL